MPDLPVSIVQSKLYPPPMAPDTVKRERLLSLAQMVDLTDKVAWITGGGTGIGEAGPYRWPKRG